MENKGPVEKQLHVPLSQGKIPKDWKWDRLDNISVGVWDCPHSTPKLAETGPYVVRTQDIRSGTLALNSTAHVSEETYRERIVRVTPSHGDLLYSREGTYFGIAAEVPRNVRLCLGQRMVLIRPNPSIAFASFVRYWLNSPVMANHINGYRDGSVAERLNLPIIRGLPIILPPLAEQKRIAGILGALDDKIELNRKMNETLEHMARALFKSWFVDFDPVHAKAAGRKPAGIDKANCDLFPDELVDSQLGTIPRGWRTATLSDCCEKIFSGGTPDRSRKDFWHGNIPWLSSGETRNSFIIKTEECITPAGVDNSSTRLAKRGNTVIASAGQGQTRGQTSLLSGDFYINQSIIALEPKSGEPYELLNYFGIERRYDELRQLSDSNSSRGSLTTKLVAQMPVIIPPKQLLISFDKIVAPIVSAIVNNEAQSESLSSTRDAVLIKLLGK